MNGDLRRINAEERAARALLAQIAWTWLREGLLASLDELTQRARERVRAGDLSCLPPNPLGPAVGA